MSEVKIPTDKEKIAQYERFLHALNMTALCADNAKMGKLIQNADSWSYAHRVGNGEIEEIEQEKVIARKFWKLCEIE